MIPVPSVEQIRRADQYTIDHEPISSINLMERASSIFVNWFIGKYKDKSLPIVVFSGPGNNGGDGLCIARLLNNLKYNLVVYVFENGAYSKDFLEQLNKIRPFMEPVLINAVEIPTLDEQSIVIDAIFGSGLSREPEGIFKIVIDLINSKSAECVSIDIPSGLFADIPGSETYIHANHTITFQYPKQSFLLSDSEKAVGNLHIVDIGLNPYWAEKEHFRSHLIEKYDIVHRLKRREEFSHKGTFGHAFLIGGSYGKMGAMVLALRACLRSGVGKVTGYIPDSGNTILQISVPEAMCISDIGAKFNLKTPPEKSSYSGIGIGPGMGMHSDTISMMAKFIQRRDDPIVLDADSLNILAFNKELIKEVPKKSILTPHPGEFKRLVGEWLNDYDKLEMQKEFSSKYGVIVVLKGKYTSISTPDGNIFFNPTGNPGMATAGSGDVLTGIITSFLAQGYSPLDSAILGVYIHGMAGDLASSTFGIDGLIAGDIINELPKVFKDLKSK